MINIIIISIMILILILIIRTHTAAEDRRLHAHEAQADVLLEDAALLSEMLVREG